MTSHELADYLLKCDDLPVMMPGNDEEGWFEVGGASFNEEGEDRHLDLGYFHFDGKWWHPQERINK